MKKRKEKKLLVCLAVGILLTLGVVGFIGGSAVANKKVTVTYWHFHGSVDLKVAEELIKEFNVAHPNIYVKPAFSGAASKEFSSEKLLTAVAGGMPPDVAHFDRFRIANWAARGALTCLDDYAREAGITEEIYYPFAWEESCYNEHLYALPLDTDCRAFYYNRALFKEAGLNPDRPPVTIAELDEYAEKLTKYGTDGKLTQFGFGPWLYDAILPYTFGWVFGGKFYDKETHKVTANDPKIVESFEWMATYPKKYGLKAIMGFPAAYGISAIEHPFLIGKLAMMVGGDWYMARIDKYMPDLDYGIAPIPYPPGGEKNSTWAGGWSRVIPEGAQHPKEAWEFIKWVTGPYAQKKYCESVKLIPTNRAVAKDPVFWEGQHKIFMELLPTAHCRPVMPEGTLLLYELWGASESVVHLKKTPKQALEDVTVKVQAALDKWYK